ncbi:MAG: bifunctional riboflavin kinase/FAD synthetase [Candidatus Omnitrophota bacterium]
MKRIFIRGALPPELKASVAAIGVFDGVHRGHQKVIARAVSEAGRMGVLSAVVTFDPHPSAVLQPLHPFPLITTLEHRLRLIEAMGVDVCVIVRFDRRFSSCLPENFVYRFLVGWMRARKVVIGRDFHFGCGRAGTVALLRLLGEANGFEVEQMDIIRNTRKNIRSTTIRAMIAEGKLTGVKRFLGRPFAFLGEVEGGDGRGRTLGYPTANFKKEDTVSLPPGIYLVRALWRSRAVNGLCYIGRRPTFKGKDAPLMRELHLLDYHGNLYGREILVEFFKKLRDDQVFPDKETLMAQIARDIASARRFFARKVSSRAV